ncbi:phage terminase large subunit, partial [Escherichia coli]|uniref:phage terminase large subunit n=1 Tax=Escherichia coli TaxID=562 RepID=UPI0020C070B1
GERDGFKVFKEIIQTPGDGVIIFQGMQDHTADSIKSLEGFHRAWVEEAQSLSKFSLDLLRPTIRWEDQRRGLKSQLLFSWNPRRKADAIE